MIKSSVFRALTSNASSLQASKCKGVKALSPRTTRRQLYLTPSVKSKAEKNTVDISGQDSFFQSKFLYYEAQIKSLQEKNAHSSPEKLELCLEYLEALLQFTPNQCAIYRSAFWDAKRKQPKSEKEKEAQPQWHLFVSACSAR